MTLELRKNQLNRGVATDRSARTVVVVSKFLATVLEIDASLLWLLEDLERERSLRVVYVDVLIGETETGSVMLRGKRAWQRRQDVER